MDSNKKDFLYNLIQKREQQYERKKVNRFIITVFCFSLIFFCLFYSIMNNGLIESIFAALFCGFFHVLVHSYVFNYLIEKSNEESLEIKQLKDEFKNLDRI